MAFLVALTSRVNDGALTRENITWLEKVMVMVVMMVMVMVMVISRRFSDRTWHQDRKSSR